MKCGDKLEVTEATRKKKFNAPKRIKKIESMIDRHEKEIAELDEDMIANGTNRGKLQTLQASKDKLQIKVNKLMEEYEELLEILD